MPLSYGKFASTAYVSNDIIHRARRALSSPEPHTLLSCDPPRQLNFR